MCKVKWFAKMIVRLGRASSRRWRWQWQWQWKEVAPKAKVRQVRAIERASWVLLF